MATTTQSEKREEKQDLQTPDIPSMLMYTDREEIMMEGTEPVRGSEATQCNRRRKENR